VRHVGQPGDRRRGRFGAGRHDDRPAGTESLAVDRDFAGRGDAAAAADESAAPALEPVHGNLVAPGVGGLVADPAGHR